MAVSTGKREASSRSMVLSSVNASLHKQRLFSDQFAVAESCLTMQSMVQDARRTLVYAIAPYSCSTEFLCLA